MTRSQYLPIFFTILFALFFSATQARNYFEYATAMKPHPDKEYKGGEDAFFANQNLFAVADGVGGWANHGVDPGIYSKTLCTEIGKLFENNPDAYTKNPKKLIKEAWELDTHIGSSTLVVAILDPEKPIMRTSYVGDSGYYILRKTGMKWKIQKDNFPYQLGYLKEHGDHPDVALRYDHPVKENDIVIVGSDGLFDNLFPSQIMNIVRGYLGEGDRIVDFKRLVEHLKTEAFKYSINTEYDSPFKRKADEQGYYYAGGKSDDITVVVGQVRLDKKKNDEL